jgi:hypothetical protein
MLRVAVLLKRGATLKCVKRRKNTGFYGRNVVSKKI